MTLLDRDLINREGGTQPRAIIDYDLIGEYSDAYKAGKKFPPIVVFYDGSTYWLADGFHRMKSHSVLGERQIECDIRQGTREDAVWYSCGANATHGKPRSNSDKRRAVETALRHPLVAGMSDRAIADHCGVSFMLVADVRKQLEGQGASSCTSPQPREGKDGKEYRQNQRQKYEAMAKEANKARTEKARATKLAKLAEEKMQAPKLPKALAKAAAAYEHEQQIKEQLAAVSKEPAPAPPAPPPPAPKQSAPAPSYDHVMAMLEPGLRAAESLPPQQRESIVRLVASRLMPDLS